MSHRTYYMHSTIGPEKRFRFHVAFKNEAGHDMYIAHSEISLDHAKEHGKRQLRQIANFSRLLDAVHGKSTEKPQIRFMEIGEEVTA